MVESTCFFKRQNIPIKLFHVKNCRCSRRDTPYEKHEPWGGNRPAVSACSALPRLPLPELRMLQMASQDRNQNTFRLLLLKSKHIVVLINIMISIIFHFMKISVSLVPKDGEFPLTLFEIYFCIVDIISTVI